MSRTCPLTLVRPYAEIRGNMGQVILPSYQPVYYGRRTTSRNYYLIYFCKVDLFKAVTYNGLGHLLDFPNAQCHYFLPVYNGHQIDSRSNYEQTSHKNVIIIQ